MPSTGTQAFSNFDVYLSTGKNPAVFDREIRDFTYACLRDMYYYNDRVSTTFVPTSVATPEAVLDACKLLPQDRFSYLVKDGNAFLNQISTGESRSYGLFVKSDASDNLRIAQVEANSPAAAAGLRRGMTLVSLNGSGGFRAGIPFASLDNQTSLALVVADTNGTQRSVMLTNTTFNKNTVLRTDVRVHAGKKVGYVLFTQFGDSSIGELNRAFDRFKAENVTELVLDMRYNGGGRVNTATHLAGLIAGQLDGVVFNRNAHNTRYAAWNTESTIARRANSLALTRLFVIMTGSTASASELIVNGLNPHIQVVTIGSQSYGKNTGAYPVLHDKSGYVVALVNILSKNSIGFGEYSAGFKPLIAETDDLSRDFGDPRERCYAAALSVIEKGTLPKASAAKQAAVVASERPLIRDDKFSEPMPMLYPTPKALQH
jgi:carboxyl-terminal processing protease